MAFPATVITAIVIVLRSTAQFERLLALIGIATGTAASLAISNLIASLLFGTEATDRTTFLSMTLLLLIVALLAGYIPARRASRINPMVALRNN
jgi:ABC-type antimicrobial peptide transport system permease subunit